MKLLRLFNPVPAVRDLLRELARPNPYRGRIALLAAAATFCIFSVLWNEDFSGPPHPPEIVYISTFAPGRTEAEIIASNIANQKEKERLVVEQAERNEEVTEIYRKLGEMSGMDVKAIERKAAAGRAAEQKAKAVAGQ